MNTITKAQFEELKEAYEIMDDQQFGEKLEEYTGIKREPYVAHNYYDLHGNYIGNSEEYDLDTILLNAYVEVLEDGK